MSRSRALTIVLVFANLILILGGLFYALMFAYGLYRYSRGRYSLETAFSSSTALMLFLVIVASIAGLAFACLRLEPSRRIKSVFLLVSTAVSLYAGELYLGTLDPPPSWVQWAKAAKKANVKFDARTKREVLIDLRTSGVDAVPAVYPRLFLKEQPDGGVRSTLTVGGVETLPMAGIANKVTIFCNEIGEYLIYRSDEFGFHNSPGVWSWNDIDIAAVGDSFVQGACVSSGAEFMALVRNRYPKTLNFGMASNGLLSMLAGLREYAAFKRPRVVLWCYFEGGGLGALRRERRSPLLLRYLASDFTQNLRQKQPAIDHAIGDYVETALRSASSVLERRPFGEDWLLPVLRVVKLENFRTRSHVASFRSLTGYDPAAARMQEGEAEFLQRILLLAKTYVGGWGGTLYFVYFPEYDRYATPASPSPNRERVLAVVHSVGVRLIDLHPAFLNHGDPQSLFPFRQRGHYNADGNRLTADEILRAISRFP